jgi:hypothetical protein
VAVWAPDDSQEPAKRRKKYHSPFPIPHSPFPIRQRSSHIVVMVYAASNTLARVEKCACSTSPVGPWTNGLGTGHHCSVRQGIYYIDSCRLVLILCSTTFCIISVYLVCLPGPAWLIVGTSGHELGGLGNVGCQVWTKNDMMPHMHAKPDDLTNWQVELRTVSIRLR